MFKNNFPRSEYIKNNISLSQWMIWCIEHKAVFPVILFMHLVIILLIIINLFYYIFTDVMPEVWKDVVNSYHELDLQSKKITQMNERHT